MELLFKRDGEYSLKFVDKLDKDDERIKNAKRVIDVDCFDNPMIYYIEE